MRIEHYTETYLEDAMRLCKYIAGENGTISIVMADSVNFPEPVKGQEFPDPLYAVRVTKNGVTIAECAYLSMREDAEIDIKFRNRWLISVMLGDEIRTARERAKMTVEDLASSTGYNAHSIESMERGRYNMDIRLLGRLADAMGCEIRLVEKNK